MNRKITLLVCVVIAVMMIFGACGQAPGPSASPSASGKTTADSDTVIIGEFDGQPVYKSELESWLAIMGSGPDILTDPSYSDSIQDILDTFMGFKTLDAEITKRGYIDNLTSDQIAQAEQDAQDYIDSSVQYSGLTEEEVLAEMGFTKEQLIEQSKLSYARDSAYTELVGDVKPAEDQIKQEYDSTVASQKAEMDADPKAYVTVVNSGTDVYYVPAGVRMVRKLLIPIDSAWAESIALLRESGYDAQADILLSDALSKIKTKADEVTNKIKSGLSFNDAMQQYNEDADVPEGGYPVVAGVTDYPAAFTEKAMALTSPGQTSGMFSTDEGYQIIEYMSDLAPGAAAYESVKDKISDSLLAQVQNEAWTAMINQWKSDHNVKTFAENLGAAPTETSAAPTE